MPSRSRPELRELARAGDILAAVELFERCRCKNLKGLLAQICEFEHELTPDLFDVAADAHAVVQERRRIANA